MPLLFLEWMPSEIFKVLEIWEFYSKFMIQINAVKRMAHMNDLFDIPQ